MSIDAKSAVTVYSDGGARGNPGPAGIGYVIYDTSGEVIAADGEFIGDATNNYAEYTALIRALGKALRLGAGSVSAYADSELMVRQLNGAYRVKHPDLLPLFTEAKRLASQFGRFEITHVRRANNKEADRLVNMAIDAHLAGETGSADQA